MAGDTFSINRGEVEAARSYLKQKHADADAVLSDAKARITGLTESGFKTPQASDAYRATTQEILHKLTEANQAFVGMDQYLERLLAATDDVDTQFSRAAQI